MRWIIDRCEGRAEAIKTPIGHVPKIGDIDTEGLDIQDGDLATLLNIDNQGWTEEMQAISDYLREYGDRVPHQLEVEHDKIMRALN